MTDVDVYLCPTCGGNMVFDISSQKLKCPYCNNEMDILEGNAKVKEYDFYAALSNEENSTWNNEVEVLKCDVCGAEMVVSKEQTAISCSYCNSSHVLKSKQSAGIRPEGVIPFKIDRYKASELYNSWVKRRWIAPNDLKNLHQTDKLKAIYIPYWTYDANTYSTYSGQGGEHYYVTVERDGKKVQERRTRWHHVSGRINRFFDDVLVNASNNYDQSLINTIEPFYTEAMEPYKPQFLSGYMAERYVKNVVNCFEEAKGKMHDSIVNEARSEILVRYDEARSIHVNTDYSNICYKHVLLPIWTAQYDYKGEKYVYIINGQTGEIQGKYPYSIYKIISIIVIAIIIIAAVFYYSNRG